MRYCDILLCNNLENEVWKEIEGFNLYKISNLGRLKKIDKDGSERICKQLETDKGYKYYKLQGICKWHKLRIHFLVASAFIPNKNNNNLVNHKNGNKWDNRVDNLEWYTNIKKAE